MTRSATPSRTRARNLAEQHNLFRTGDGHIHALWFNFESGWHHEDRTAMLGAPGRRSVTRSATPSSHESRNLAEQHNLFRTGDGHIHALWFNFESGWHHEDRTAMLGGPGLGRRPVRLHVHARGPQPAEQHNLFRTGDGHIHALWFNFESGWHHEDRSASDHGGTARPRTPSRSAVAGVLHGEEPRAQAV